MESREYTSQSSWDLYTLLVVHQNTSEAICDALLAVSEAMRQFAPGMSMPESALVDLAEHISRQTFKLVKNDIPDLVQCERGLYKNFWCNRYSRSTSQGLKKSIEKITMRFIEDLTRSFSEGSTGWTFTPDILHDAFKELAVSFEEALGREYNDHQKTIAARTASGVSTLSASLSNLSISGSRSAASATTARPPSRGDCFNCRQPGHWRSECPYLQIGNTRPSKSALETSCDNCGEPGHWTSNCPRSQKGSIMPSRLSASSPSESCYSRSDSGHWSSSTPSPRRGSAMTPSRTPPSGKCFKCGLTGHWYKYCPRPSRGSSTPSRSMSRDKCFSCGKIGHWAENCPTGDTR